MHERSESICWFLVLLALAVLTWRGGRSLARRSDDMVRVLSSIGAIGVGLAAVIRFRPAILHATFPLDVTIWFEGVIAVFPWMLLAGALSVASFEARGLPAPWEEFDWIGWRGVFTTDPDGNTVELVANVPKTE